MYVLNFDLLKSKIQFLFELISSFNNYKMAPNSAEGGRNLGIMLSEIQQVDPIGLNVYLTKKME